MAGIEWLALPAGATAPALAADEIRLYWQAESATPLPRRERIDGLMRTVLAPLLALPEAALQFARADKGRPYLRHEGAPDFNLSDTRGGSLLAVVARGRIGVDLERSDRAPPALRLARRWFTDAETAALQAMAPEAARLAFLQLWTAKEASCKATGTGIYGHLDQWQFDPDHASPPRLRALPAAAGAAADWRFLRVAPSSEHTAVLALWGGGGGWVSGYRIGG